MSPENYCLITTGAVEYIHLADRVKVEDDGGTRLFYRKAVEGLVSFSDKGNNFIWISPPKKTTVHIFPLQNYGYGENDSTVDPKLFSQNLESLQNPVVIISTTLRTDFNLELLKQYADKMKYLFIDVQGFTRNGREHEFFDFPEWLLNLPNVVFKIGEEDFPYVDIQKFLRNPNTIVLHTKGKKGFTLMRAGNQADVQSSEIVNRENEEQRGAGDTLLFHFALHYAQNKDLISAAHYAEKSVVSFLKEGEK